MPVNYQIVPEHKYPHQHVQINDNTEVLANYSSGCSDITALLCVFTSPKGRDNKVYTIENGLAGFMEEYGLGPFAVYGQPLLNAYAAARSNNCMLHCMRVTAQDAKYATSVLYAKVTAEGADKMKVKLFTKPLEEEITNLNDLQDTLDYMPPTVADDGSMVLPLMIVAYIGRGTYGNSIRWRLTSDKTNDKNNKYKNYFLSVYTTENGFSERERHSISFYPDAVYNGASIYAPDVINNDAMRSSDRLGSDLIKVAVSAESFHTLWEAYRTANPDTSLTEETFDPLLGIDKTTRSDIVNYELEIEDDTTAGTGTTDEPAVALDTKTGIQLTGGNEGGLAMGAADRDNTLRNIYMDAYSGKTDPYIKSKNRFPTTLILDANFPIEVKQLIASLTLARGDCMCCLDCGTQIITKASVRPYVEENLAPYITNRVQTIEAWCEKVRDPYSQKAVTVTATYWMSGRYPTHIYNYGGKHRPLAGNRFGIISGYLPNSVYPYFDEDMDFDEMDALAEMHVNYCKYNANQELCRAMQDTRQEKWTVLSEQNNMLIVLDIKRDAERIAAQFEYDFTEPEDLARYNAAMQVLVDKYQSAQVRSISAAYSQNAWEAERNYVHLNIALVCKDLVRVTIIEIDVNRSTTTTT